MHYLCFSSLQPAWLFCGPGEKDLERLEKSASAASSRSRVAYSIIRDPVKGGFFPRCTHARNNNKTVSTCRGGPAVPSKLDDALRVEAGCGNHDNTGPLVASPAIGVTA